MLPNANEHFEARLKASAAEVKSQAAQLAVLSQAEVFAGHLTQLPEWDRFLSYIAAACEEAGLHAERLERRIADPLVVDHATLMRLKISLEGWTQRKLAFEAVMSLPRDLLEMGEKARALLERMPKLEDAA